MTTAFDYILDAVNRQKQQRINPGIPVSSPLPQLQQAQAPQIQPMDNNAMMLQAIQDAENLKAQNNWNNRIANGIMHSGNHGSFGRPLTGNEAIIANAINEVEPTSDKDYDAALRNATMSYEKGVYNRLQDLAVDFPATWMQINAESWRKGPNESNEFLEFSPELREQNASRNERAAEAIRNSGINKELNARAESMANDWDGTILGSVFEGAGGMAPQMLVGGAFGFAPMMGEYLSQAGSLGTMGAGILGDYFQRHPGRSFL